MAASLLPEATCCLNLLGPTSQRQMWAPPEITLRKQGQRIFEAEGLKFKSGPGPCRGAWHCCGQGSFIDLDRGPSITWKVLYDCKLGAWSARCCLGGLSFLDPHWVWGGATSSYAGKTPQLLNIKCGHRWRSPYASMASGSSRQKAWTSTVGQSLAVELDTASVRDLL